MDMHTGYAEVHGAAACSAEDEQRHLLSYAPLVKRVVRQLTSQIGGAVDREDMEQIGLMGLLDALRRYGGAPDEKFGAYASIRIRGSILDELRRQDWRPRAVRQESHRMRDAVRELTRRLGRTPSENDIMKELGINAAELQEYRLAENAEMLVSFDEILQELSNVPASALTPEAALMSRRSLEQALGTLDEREQRVVHMYYEFDLSLKEISAVLGLTDARICQINKGALRKMKAFLQDA
ncbi:FliA/WhiG family RNA polymerase sigma factor [Acidovorax sp. SRB_24]|uniref:FliA/WhiG family RNA polymerase sigma factor n=1 Tax=Acidovorax sp. SRB_24 TaxID=1962700 RepID=UPI00145E2221|nr:RNA polymerase sigma factor FliA [Acidovorax sp. SRB_24]NMM76384.1 RNA polymerase sigma factor FliA [Acidovorax sp. SRB_24]